MNGLITLANDWAATWSGAVLRASWIGGIAILIAWAVTTFFPQIPIFARSWLWRLVYLKLLVVLCWAVPVELPLLPTIVRSTVAAPRENLTKTSSALAAVTGSQPKTTDHDRAMVLSAELAEDASLSASFWLFACWVCGVLAYAASVVRNWDKMNALRAACAPLDDRRLDRLCQELCEQLGCRVAPRLVATNAAVSPQLVGIMRPRIIVPQPLAQADAATARMILAHELAHWKRRDLMWNWLPTTVGSLFYFHPGVWLAQREWRLAQELACDETAIQAAKARPDAYGRMLLEIAGMCRSNWRPSHLSIGVGQSFRGLSRRILAMKSYQSPSRIHIMSAVAILTTVALLGLVPWKLTAREIAIASAGDDSAKNTSTESKAASSIATTTKLGGRIYISVSLRTKDANGKPVTDFNRLIAIDPNTGKWEKLDAHGTSLRISRDGSAIAFENGDKILVSDFKNGVKPHLIGDVTSGRPVWSANGKEIVVSSQKMNDEGKKPKAEKPIWTDETWKYSVDGSKKEWLPVPSTDGVEDWSPDGKWLLTCSDRHRPFGSGYQLYLISCDGAEQRRLTHGPGLNVYCRFSPDGKQVVYTYQHGKNSIRTMALADGKETVVVEQDGAKEVNAACWSPDGRYLAVSRFDWQVGPDGKYFSNADDDSNYRLEIISLDGKERREIKLQDADVRFMGHADWK
jgi:beta-lactamase regulating signal transducer with metallopeptidase domain